ncbi:helicase HerA-like domain-containing protein [Haloarcula japonica]|uniref:helicase HerA-like domain-containing protein n=1 Tax=Haloarcula japonica TaxID=29282 RepID=UPI0039F65D1C
MTREVDRINSIAEDLVENAERLSRESEKLEQEKEEVEEYVELVDGDRRKLYKQKAAELSEERKQNLEQLKKTADELEAIRDHIYRFQKSGVMLAYLFTFSTDARLVHREDLNQACIDQLDHVYSLHQRKVKQILSGPKFKLQVDEVTHPRVLMRQEHTLMYNPKLTDFLEDDHTGPVLDELERMRDHAVEHYMAISLEDIQTGHGLRERSKSTPSRAVNSILQELPAEDFTEDVEDIPQDGPLIGTVSGTEMSFGIDLADGEHYYIVGETGSGKSYLKRVLIENSVDLGYDVLSINPDDRQVLSAAFRNDLKEEFNQHDDHPVEPEHAKGVTGDYYWPSHDLLLDLPDDITDLFHGSNFLCLDQFSGPETDEFIAELFEALSAERDRTKPLIVFLDEAHKVAEGEPAEKIQEVIREARKFGVHVVLSTQSPMDFTHNQKHVRQNLTGIFFLYGKYTDYASNFNLADEIKDLETGKAIYHHRDQPPFEFNVRPPLSRVPKTSSDRLKRLDKMYSPEIPDQLEGNRRSGTITVEEDTETPEQKPELSEDEEEVLTFIESWIRDNDEAPTYSKCHREGPFSTTKTRKLLNKLMEKGFVEERIEDRYGNESQVYYPT